MLGAIDTEHSGAWRARAILGMLGSDLKELGTERLVLEDLDGAGDTNVLGTPFRVLGVWSSRGAQVFLAVFRLVLGLSREELGPALGVLGNRAQVLGGLGCRACYSGSTGRSSGCSGPSTRVLRLALDCSARSARVGAS